MDSGNPPGVQMESRWNLWLRVKSSPNVTSYQLISVFIGPSRLVGHLPTCECPFHVTQSPDEANSFVLHHPAHKRSQQLCFVSPSPQTIPLASFRMTQPHIVYILKYNYSLRHVRPMSETGYRPVVNWSEP
jgi:hypothetical protein